MSKTLVVCLDGTWNGPDVEAADGSSTPTNVQKLFEGLRGSAPLGPTENEKEVRYVNGQGAVAQVAKYINGVGDATNLLAQKVEGAFGCGLIARVVRGYTYLSREYQAGDQIYIVGFSRGAYTARALAGFVTTTGLLDWTAMQLVAGSASSYRAGVAAWQEYKSSLHCDDQGILHALAESVTDISDRLQLGLFPAPRLQLIDSVLVAAVGVWETVGALGVPDLVSADGTVVRRDEFEFADTSLSAKVARGFHAVAIDERRVDFTPTLWDSRDGVAQVLFPGAHADVGGGYPLTESGLSNCALAWMAAQLSSSGVLFGDLAFGKPDPLGIAHQPWMGALYRQAIREFPPTLELSQRVLQRVAGGPVPIENVAAPAAYRPANLTNSYLKIDWSGPAAHTQVAP